MVIKWLSLRPLLSPEAQSRVGVTAYTTLYWFYTENISFVLPVYLEVD